MLRFSAQGESVAQPCPWQFAHSRFPVKASQQPLTDFIPAFIPKQSTSGPPAHLDDAVEGAALVTEALLAGGQGDEVGDCLGDVVAVQTQHDAPSGLTCMSAGRNRCTEMGITAEDQCQGWWLRCSWRLYIRAFKVAELQQLHGAAQTFVCYGT